MRRRMMTIYIFLWLISFFWFLVLFLFLEFDFHFLLLMFLNIVHYFVLYHYQYLYNYIYFVSGLLKFYIDYGNLQENKHNYNKNNYIFSFLSYYSFEILSFHILMNYNYLIAFLHYQNYYQKYYCNHLLFVCFINSLNQIHLLF